MDCINELRDSLNVHLGWNKARITCFVNRLLALLTVRTVNLNKLACVVIGNAQLLRIPTKWITNSERCGSAIPTHLDH
jgi:hypothetical protein